MTTRLAALVFMLALVACGSSTADALFVPTVIDVDAGNGAADTSASSGDAGPSAPDGSPPSDDAEPDAEADAGSSPDTASPADAGPATSDASTALNGCQESDFIDYRAPGADRVVYFATSTTAPDGAPYPLEYSPRCMRIAPGESVTWRGNFASHSLGPSGSNTLNPVPTLDNGAEVTVKFGTPGRYGYECQQHSTMRGVIDVAQ